MAHEGEPFAYTITHTESFTISTRHPWLIAGFAYALGAVLFLWPMPAQIGQVIWGDRFDAWTTLWLIDHLAVRIGSFDLAPLTTDILYPIGYNLWSFGHLALQAIGGAMVVAGVPLVVSYNLLLLFGIASSAMAAHALGRELTGSHLAGGLAGVVFATTPYLYAEAGAGCIELVAAGVLPLHALCLVRLMRRPSQKRMWVATFTLAAIGPFNWYYTLFAGIFAAAFIVWQIVEVGPTALMTPRQATHRRGIKLILVSLVLAAAIDVPLISQARRETPTRPSISAELFSAETAFSEVREVTNGSTPLAELTQEKLSRVDAMQVHFNSTSISALLKARFEPNPLYSTPGRFAFCMGLFGLIIAGRRTWGWLAIGAGATVLTLGPFLNISGSLILPSWASGLPLPYYWAHEYLPFFSKAYRPYRIGVITAMCLSSIAAIGAATWLRSVRLPHFGLPLVIFGLIGFSQPHWSDSKPASRPIANTAVDAAYTDLAALESGAVIELPLLYQPVSAANAKTQFHQTIHRHPILNTNQLIRWPDLLRFKDYISQNTVLQAFVDLARRPTPIAINTADITALDAQGFRWIVARRQVLADEAELSGERIHVDLIGAQGWRFLETAFGEAVINTGAVMVWDVRNLTHAEATIQETGQGITDLPLIFDPVFTGFPLILMRGQATEIFQGDASKFNIWIRPISDDSAISLRIEDGGVVRELPLKLVNGHWQYNSLVIGSTNTLKLSLVGRSEGPSQVMVTRASVTK